MFLDTFQGNRHVSISPAVVPNFVTLKKLSKLLDTVNTHGSQVSVTVTIRIAVTSQVTEKSLFTAVGFPLYSFNSSYKWIGLVWFNEIHILCQSKYSAIAVNIFTLKMNTTILTITHTHLTRAFTANLTTVERRKRGVTRM